MAPSIRPGVVIEQFSPVVRTEFRTGVAGFVGFAINNGGTLPAAPDARAYTSWHDFAYAFRDGREWALGRWHPDSLLWNAVQGFFGNGGQRCHVVFYDPAATGDPAAALDLAVEVLAGIDDVDLVCAPSLMSVPDPKLLQRQLIASSEKWRREQNIEWFLILDAPPPELDTSLADWLDALRVGWDRPYDAALYHPWLVLGGEFEPAPGTTSMRTPPSGHVAGIYARSDQRVGVHKAPANEEIFGVVDVVSVVPDIPTANPVVAVPGRGIRILDARTLAVIDSPVDPHGFVNMRRLTITLERWLVRAFDWVVFETNDFRLWVRLHRELEDKLTELFQRGAFKGKTPSDAFRIKCDEENNPTDAREAGLLCVDIQIAPAVPQVFITIRLIRSAGALAIA